VQLDFDVRALMTVKFTPTNFVRDGNNLQSVPTFGSNIIANTRARHEIFWPVLEVAFIKIRATMVALHTSSPKENAGLRCIPHGVRIAIAFVTVTAWLRQS
jgi:hypothetical protein